MFCSQACSTCWCASGITETSSMSLASSRYMALLNWYMRPPCDPWADVAPRPSASCPGLMKHQRPFVEFALRTSRSGERLRARNRRNRQVQGSNAGRVRRRARRRDGRRARGRSAGSRCGSGAPRLSSRSSAQRGDQPGERMRVVAQRARALRRRASSPACAPQRLARGLRGRLRAARPSGASAGADAAGAARRGRPARRACPDEALAQRVGRQAVGAVQAGARGLADGVEAGDASSAPSRSATTPPMQ